jgi:hypothetical protein
MSIGDFTILEQNSMTGRGARLYNVTNGSTIYAGEPVARSLGGTTVIACLTNAGQVGTDYIVGIAATSSASNKVYVIPTNNGLTYLANPNSAAAYDTQTEYNALVGKRVLIDLTTGAYTVLATDAAGNGLVIQAMDIAEHPGKVAVAFRAALSDLA